MKNEICKVEWCDRPVYGKGYCYRHWQQIRRKGYIYNSGTRTMLNANEIVIEGKTCYMALTDRLGNYKAISAFDVKFLEEIKKYKWHANGHGYCVGRVGGSTVRLARFIMEFKLRRKLKSEEQIDHINHDKYDDRVKNLRICSSAENCWNRKKTKANTSGYKGVSVIKNTEKYASHIKVYGKSINLGTFNNKADAARRYDEAAVKYFGEFANINGV
jgi:hypothetical protein